MAGINVRRVRNYVNKYNNDEERRSPVSRRKCGTGCKAKLTEIHSDIWSEYLVGFIDEHPTAVLLDSRSNLYEAFPKLCISISALHRRLIEKCKVTLKKLQNCGLQEIVTVCSKSERNQVSISILNGIKAVLGKGTRAKDIVPTIKL
jgi:hypothetical protein